MSYSSDLRTSVLDYIETGGLIKTACDTFNVSRSSIQRWRTRKAETGDLSPTTRKNLPYKVDDIKLLKFIASNPDAYLNEIAEAFGISDSGAWRALKRLNVTRKKSPRSTQSEMK